MMIMNFSESSHPMFGASSVFEMRELRSKGGERSLHTSTVVMRTLALLLCRVISANQLSIYGAAAEL